MRKIRYILGIVSILFVGIMLVACTPTETPDENTEITITLNESVVNLAQSETFTLIATVTNSEAAVEWSSSNAQVATVLNGTVTGVSQGTTTITATVADKTATATVVVSAEPFPVLTVSQEAVELLFGGDGITVTPEVKLDGSIVTATFVWTVADPSIAKVTNGLIEPLAIGETTVKVSATYNGEVIEKTITVIVNIDASVLLSKYSVDLDVVDVDGNQMLEDSVDISAIIEGAEVTDQAFTLELDSDIVDYDLVDQTITITSLSAGTANLTVSFMHEGVKVFSVITISVHKSIHDIAQIVYFDLSATEDQPLDFAGLGITETVISVKYGDTIISDATDASIILPTWIATISNGDIKHVTIETAFVTYNLAINFSITSVDVDFELTVDNTVGATYTYDDTDKVYTYNTGVGTDAWSNRLQSAQSAIQSYDYMIMDIKLTEALTGNINFWMDMALGDVNVTVLKPDGTKTGDRLFIFDTDKELVLGSLAADTVYTFVIRLGHGDPEGRYAFGVNQATTIYMSDTRATTTHYAETTYNFGDALKDSKIDINF